jgi:hypothetical protein
METRAQSLILERRSNPITRMGHLPLLLFLQTAFPLKKNPENGSSNLRFPSKYPADIQNSESTTHILGIGESFLHIHHRQANI